MAEHYTKATVEVRKWCRKHKRQTLHAVQGGRAGTCLECLQELNDLHDLNKGKSRPAEQRSLF